MVAVPKPVFAAKDTLTSVKAYAADGVKTAAAHAMFVGENCAVPPTPESTPPGALVVSRSTTDEPTTCGAADGSAEPLRDRVGDIEGVPLLVGDPEGVPLRVGDADLVPDGVGVGERDGDGVPVCDAPAEGDADGGTAV